MNTSDATGSPEEFERYTDTPEAESVPHEHHACTENIKRPRLIHGPTTLAVLGLVAVGLGVLINDPGVVKVCRSVLQDPQVQKVCREAGESIYCVVAESWRQHGGPVALAEVLLR